MLVTGGGGFAGPHLLTRSRAAPTGGRPVARRARPDATPPPSRGAVAGADCGLPPRRLQLAAALLGAPARGAADERGDDAQPARGGPPRGARRRPSCWSARARSTATPATLPVTEDAPLAPGNPYAVSKAACDLLGAQYAEAHGLRVVRLRPFNHAGPGQSDEYVLSSLARQVAEAEAAGADEAGAAHRRRERQARLHRRPRRGARPTCSPRGAEPGAYNVCSGRSARVAELIDALAERGAVPGPPRGRPRAAAAHDAREMRGSHERFTAATGWEPRDPARRHRARHARWWRERQSDGVERRAARARSARSPWRSRARASSSSPSASRGAGRPRARPGARRTPSASLERERSAARPPARAARPSRSPRPARPAPSPPARSSRRTRGSATAPAPRPRRRAARARRAARGGRGSSRRAPAASASSRARSGPSPATRSGTPAAFGGLAPRCPRPSPATGARCTSA